MGNETPSSSQAFLTTIGMNFDLHFKPVLEKGMEKEVMISLEILDSNSLLEESFEAFKNGKVFRKRKRLWGRRKILLMMGILKSEKKFEEVA
jgi:hypothetical protein